MSRANPASPAWAAYYERHPEVLANWAESNGREPVCTCSWSSGGLGLPPEVEPDPECPEHFPNGPTPPRAPTGPVLFRGDPEMPL
jgi:hypothetical protein